MGSIVDLAVSGCPYERHLRNYKSYNFIIKLPDTDAAQVCFQMLPLPQNVQNCHTHNFGKLGNKPSQPQRRRFKRLGGTKKSQLNLRVQENKHILFMKLMTIMVLRFISPNTSRYTLEPTLQQFINPCQFTYCFYEPRVPNKSRDCFFSFVFLINLLVAK